MLGTCMVQWTQFGKLGQHVEFITTTRVRSTKQFLLETTLLECLEYFCSVHTK